jgi:hypothetical protein
MSKKTIFNTNKQMSWKFLKNHFNVLINNLNEHTIKNSKVSMNKRNEIKEIC